MWVVVVPACVSHVDMHSINVDFKDRVYWGDAWSDSVPQLPCASSKYGLVNISRWDKFMAITSDLVYFTLKRREVNSVGWRGMF